MGQEASTQQVGPGAIPLVVFAKPPRPGLVKTRLAAKIGDVAACDLATAFINDFLASAARLPWAFPVLATTEDGMLEDSFPADAYPEGMDPGDVPRWLQPPGDLGAKMEGIVRRGLGEAGAVVCCGADSPGRPIERLEQTQQALNNGADAVLGPTDDGGYDILALIRCPEGLLANLPWSQPTTFEATKDRLEAQGFRVVVLDMWWDVDEAEDLERLRGLLRTEAGAERAPATTAALARADAGRLWGWTCCVSR